MLSVQEVYGKSEAAQHDSFVNRQWLHQSSNRCFNDPANIRTPCKFVDTDAVEFDLNFKYVNFYQCRHTQHL